MDLPLTTITVFVGPNGSGKSQALRDIESHCLDQAATGHKVIASIVPELPTSEAEVFAILESLAVEPPPGQPFSPDEIFLSKYSFVGQREPETSGMTRDGVRRAFSSGSGQELAAILLPHVTIRLDGRRRFVLSDPKPADDLLGPPKNHLSALLRDDASRERVREITHDAFNLHFVIDPTGMTQLRPRMSSRAPTSDEALGLGPAARAFYSNAPLLSTMGDGIQTFTGLVSAVLSFPHKVMLIDEPEAFLHPTLARRLGSHLSAIATDRSGNLIAASHSAAFLMGCLEASSNVSVVRLTFEAGRATAQSLAAPRLVELMRDQLLRSTDALEGLFHRVVVITEADADRAFYSEINNRLLSAGRGVRDALFVNTQNWQTISRIAAPLTALGVARVGIIDLDAIWSDDNTAWAKLYKALGISASLRDSLEADRARCRTLLDGDKRTLAKRDGLPSLGNGERAAYDSLIQRLSAVGVFIVNVGELEGWLSYLGVTRSGSKSDWILDVFGRLGSDPAHASYVRPGSDDVWSFLDSVEAYAAQVLEHPRSA